MGGKLGHPLCLPHKLEIEVGTEKQNLRREGYGPRPQI